MRCLLAAWTLVAAVSPVALGHPPAVPRVSAIEASSPVVVDGRLDDKAWGSANWATGFVERKPTLGAKPADTTAFAVVYDAKSIYVGVRMLDMQPDTILAKTLTRDSFNVFSDDAISVKLDPHHDHRTTFGFAVNAGSAMLDYKGVNEQRFERGVDYVWEARTQRTPAGWTAEFRIPWSSLGLDPANPPEVMGINLSRDHPRRNATYDWSLLASPYSPISASRYGQLVGFKPPRGASSSVAWSVEPYVLGGFRRDRVDDARVDTQGVFNAGADASLSLGQTVGMHLSVNTDFAQVDLDDQVVNLTRFGLFLEEKRDFFLSDLELFDFGRSGRAQLLYTRRIGLTAGGGEVPLMTGLKVVGRPHERVQLGLLHVTTRPLEAAGVPWQQHTVARLQVQADDGSTGGFMATWRQSYERLGARNLVLGFDGTWRGAGTPLFVNAFGLMSLTGADAGPVEPAAGGSGTAAPDTPALAVGFDLVYRDLLLRPRVSYAYYAPEFRADLGYFRRVGGHEPEIGFEWVPRFNAGGIEKLSIEFEAGAWVWDVDNTAWETTRFDWSAELGATLYWESGFTLGVETTIGRAAVLDDFFVGAETSIAAGDYVDSEVALAASTPSQHLLSASMEVARRDFFGGELYGASVGLTLKPSALFRLDLTASYDHAFFPDPAKDFDSATLNARITMGFTPELGASFYAGWNYLADRLRTQARLRWSYLPGSDLFVVYQLDSRPEPFQEVFQSLLVKLSFHYPWDS